jgi:hypothetical protein
MANWNWSRFIRRAGLQLEFQLLPLLPNVEAQIIPEPAQCFGSSPAVLHSFRPSTLDPHTLFNSFPPNALLTDCLLTTATREVRLLRSRAPLSLMLCPSQ